MAVHFNVEVGSYRFGVEELGLTGRNIALIPGKIRKNTRVIIILSGISARGPGALINERPYSET